MGDTCSIRIALEPQATTSFITLFQMQTSMAQRKAIIQNKRYQEHNIHACIGA
jgi:hypothetical protein